MCEFACSNVGHSRNWELAKADGAERAGDADVLRSSVFTHTPEPKRVCSLTESPPLICSTQNLQETAKEQANNPKGQSLKVCLLYQCGPELQGGEDTGVCSRRGVVTCESSPAGPEQPVNRQLWLEQAFSAACRFWIDANNEYLAWKISSVCNPIPPLNIQACF